MSMKERIIKILNNFGVDNSAVTDNANFMKDLGFDSLDTVDLMMQLEQEFNIAIPDDDYAKIVTVKSLVEYLEERQNVLA
jgi:acyl carrier protein